MTQHAPVGQAVLHGDTHSGVGRRGGRLALGPLQPPHELLLRRPRMVLVFLGGLNIVVLHLIMDALVLGVLAVPVPVVVAMVVAVVVLVGEGRRRQEEERRNADVHGLGEGEGEQM